MPTPGISLQGLEIGHHPRAQRVQVDVSREFEQVGLFLDHDGLVPVLEKVPPPAMPAVEGPRIAREERAHHAREGTQAGPDQEVGVIRQEGPGVDGHVVRLRQAGQAAYKVLSVQIIPKNSTAFDAPHHYMMQGTGRVQAGAPWHAGSLSWSGDGASKK